MIGTMKQICNHHDNGFKHWDFEELDADYDTGIKFERKESDERLPDRNAYFEPTLVLYVSVAHPEIEGRPTLKYGRTRLKFEDRWNSDDEEGELTLDGKQLTLDGKPLKLDEKRLLTLAERLIVQDAKALVAGGNPESAQTIVML